MEDYILVKPTMEYAEQIVEYRNAFLEAGDSMDGLGPLRRIKDPSEYIKFCETCENPATVPETILANGGVYECCIDNVQIERNL